MELFLFNTTCKWKKNCQFFLKTDYTSLHVGQHNTTTVSFFTALVLAIHLFVSSIK